MHRALYEDAAWVLALLMTPGVGRRRIHRGLRSASSRSRAAAVAPDPTLTVSGPLLSVAREIVDRAVDDGTAVLAPSSPEYPAFLTDCLAEDAPPVLFVRGDLTRLQGPALGIVGTVQPSEEGVKVTQECAQFAASLPEGPPADVPCVVSGGARGVDSVAHGAALSAGGTTLVILPQGISTYRPSEQLTAALHEGRATLVSEFLPDAPWETHAAVTRNATISAFSRVLCVVEPRRIGGSVRTAREALAQGKDVFAHCEPRSGQMATLLRQAGVRELLTADGDVDVCQLQEAWIRYPRAGAQQTELF